MASNCKKGHSRLLNSIRISLMSRQELIFFTLRYGNCSQNSNFFGSTLTDDSTKGRITSTTDFGKFIFWDSFTGNSSSLKNLVWALIPKDFDALGECCVFWPANGVGSTRLLVKPANIKPNQQTGAWHAVYWLKLSFWHFNTVCHQKIWNTQKVKFWNSWLTEGWSNMVNFWECF